MISGFDQAIKVGILVNIKQSRQSPSRNQAIETQAWSNFDLGCGCQYSAHISGHPLSSPLLPIYRSDEALLQVACWARLPVNWVSINSIYFVIKGQMGWWVHIGQMRGSGLWPILIPHSSSLSGCEYQGEWFNKNNCAVSILRSGRCILPTLLSHCGASNSIKMYTTV